MPKCLATETTASRVYCELVAIAPKGDEAVLATIMKACFPTLAAPEDGLPEVEMVVDADSGEARPRLVRQPGVRHVFGADSAPLCEVLTLSCHMPSVAFTLEYRASEQPDAVEGGLAEFIGGELKRDVRAEGVPASDQYGENGLAPLGNWWLRGVAEQILKSAYDAMFSDVEGGFEMRWKDSMTMNLEFEAYGRLTSLLDPIDRQILDAQESAYRTRLGLGKKRRAVADLKESLEQVVAKYLESDAASEILTGDDLQHVKATAGILEKIAGGVPATSQRI